MNKIYTLTMLLFLVTTISAYYPGETIQFNNTIGENVVWTIIENTTEITTLPIVDINLENITITFPANMTPNNFKIVFLEETIKEIIKTVTVSSGSGGSGGGSSGIQYVTNTKYVEVPNYVTQYVNSTNEIQGNNTIEYKEVSNKLPTKYWIVVIIVFILSLIFSILIGAKYFEFR